MKISNIFLGQRNAKYEDLYFDYNDYNLQGVPNGQGKVAISAFKAALPADQEYMGGGTHGTYIDAGDVYPNKAGIFKFNISFRIGPPFGSAVYDGRFTVRCFKVDSSGVATTFHESEHEVEITADNLDRWTTLAIETFTPFMVKGDYFYTSFTANDGGGPTNIQRVDLSLTERARIIK